MKVFNDRGEFTVSLVSVLCGFAAFPLDLTGHPPQRELITEGSNLTAMWLIASDKINIDHLDSNDIWAIHQTYGVEAARAAIIRELSGVFGAYGIAVDYRHLTIIADYMVSCHSPLRWSTQTFTLDLAPIQTHEGGFKPFNRTGIASKSSPLLKASFETTAAFLSEATLHGDFDDLRSPSASLVMGAPSKSGTGVFDLRANMIAATA
jgi:DNA-directed RNA polymerase I subunit RPA1